MGALSGLRVLDLSRLLPGPYLTLLLADQGAEVVKVEDPAGGDYLRALPPVPEGSDSGALFQTLNRNKRSVALDLRTAEHRQLFLELLATYDVVVESFRPGVLDRLGLGYARLAAAQPRLILVSLSGWGQGGPLAQKAGHDVNYLARTGVVGFGGSPRELPPLCGVQIADIGGAMLGTIALLAAVIERQRTGRGRHLDVALADAGLAFLQPHLGARLAMGAAGTPLERGTGMLNGGGAGYRIYRTRDGRALSVGALEPKFWLAFCEALGLDHLSHLAYTSGTEGERVAAEVAQVIAGRTLAEWEEFLATRDLCCEPVREGDEVLADAFVKHRGFLREGEGGLELVTPLKLDPPPQRPAPRLGEHNAEVLKECGLDPARLGP